MISAKLPVNTLTHTHGIKPLSLKISKKYPFVDLIRFISMIGIVWGHSIFVPENLNTEEYLTKLGHVEYFILFKQVFKFGVLCFYMISGVLLGRQLDETTSLGYLKKRMGSLLKPFLFASGLFLLELIIVKYVFNKTTHNNIGEMLYYTYFGTMFWYIPNYLICLSTLLLFKNYLKSLSFGFILLVVNIVYSLLTVYDSSFVTGHMGLTSIFSYLFYLWLGVYIVQNDWIEKIQALNPFMLFSVVIVLYLLSSFDAFELFERQMMYFNILRICNQAYSIAVFVLLIRVCKENPRFWKFNPRKESYGIYLYHGFFIIILPNIFKWVTGYWGIQWQPVNMGYYLLGLLFYFIVLYLSTVMLVKILQRFKLAYL